MILIIDCTRQDIPLLTAEFARPLQTIQSKKVVNATMFASPEERPFVINHLANTENIMAMKIESNNGPINQAAIFIPARTMMLPDTRRISRSIGGRLVIDIMVLYLSTSHLIKSLKTLGYFCIRDALPCYLLHIWRKLWIIHSFLTSG